MKSTVAPAPHLRRAGFVVVIVSLAAIAFATLLPEPTPAVGSILCIVCGTAGTVSAILNVFLFMPLGIGLSLSRIPGKRALFGMFALSVLIETAQYFVIPGRYSTIGDVLTNTLGGALGFAISQYAFSLLRPPPRLALVLSFAWTVLWLGIQTTSAYGFSPAIPRSGYYGEIAPSLGDFEQFHGAVINASIGDLGIRDSHYSESERARDLLLRGAPLRTTIVPDEHTSGVAPIVRIADDDEREVVLLGQQGDNLVFGIRTGAAVLRLRPPYFSLPDAFAASPSGDSGTRKDTLSVSARYSTREVVISGNTRTGVERHIPITASLGWTMLLPFQWFIEGTRIEHLVNIIWIVCLVLPIGYWGTWFVRCDRAREARRNPMLAVPIALVVLYCGLVLVPQAFGASAALAMDWLAALAGMLSGGVLATRGVHHLHNAALINSKPASD
jgi:hypothetical protein